MAAMTMSLDCAPKQPNIRDAKLFFWLLVFCGLVGFMILVGCRAQRQASVNPTTTTQPATRITGSKENAKIAAKLRELGMVLLIYIDTHNGKFPVDLGALAIAEGQLPQSYVLPHVASEVPTNWQSMDPQAQRAWINDNSALAYIGRGLVFGADYSSKTSLALQQIVVAYQRIPTSAAGTNVLYLDMHVEFDDWNTAKGRIGQTQALLRTLPRN